MHLSSDLQFHGVTSGLVCHLGCASFQIMSLFSHNLKYYSETTNQVRLQIVLNETHAQNVHALTSSQTACVLLFCNRDNIQEQIPVMYAD